MIGKNIYRIRSNRGLTLTELAGRAGIAKSYLSNIERGINQNPSINVMEKISTVLQVDLHALLESDSKPKSKKIDQELIDLVQELKDSGIEKDQIQEFRSFIDFVKWQRGQNN